MAFRTPRRTQIDERSRVVPPNLVHSATDDDAGAPAGLGCGLEVVARDEGPGISDVDAALRDGYGARGGLGLGLPGAKRLMDEFGIVSRLGAGTVVTMKKWRERDELERLREKQHADG